jgi:lysyl-tRNA synthetase class 2
MDEMDELLQLILACEKAERLSYQEAFERHAHLNPHTAKLTELKTRIQKINLANVAGVDYNDRDLLLQWLMTHDVEPQLGQTQPTFIYDYPATQAALARIRREQSHPPIAERFEVYIKGIELANGFHELSDAKEQRARFQSDIEKRKKNNYPDVIQDEHLLAALAHGLPNCAGVALGIDRLVMLALKKSYIEEVIAFPASRA